MLAPQTPYRYQPLVFKSNKLEHFAARPGIVCQSDIMPVAL